MLKRSVRVDALNPFGNSVSPDPLPYLCDNFAVWLFQIHSFIFTSFATICFILYVYFRLLSQFLFSSCQGFSCETTFPNRLSYNAATPLHPSHSSTFQGRILTNFYATFTTLNVAVDLYSCLPAVLAKRLLETVLPYSERKTRNSSNRQKNAISDFQYAFLFPLPIFYFRLSTALFLFSFLFLSFLYKFIFVELFSTIRLE